MTKYLTIGLLGALCAALVALMVMQRQNAALSAENASLSRSIAVLEDSRAQARLAADVARAEAQRERDRAVEYDAFREALIEGNEDAELPEWFQGWLRELLP